MCCCSCLFSSKPRSAVNPEQPPANPEQPPAQPRAIHRRQRQVVEYLEPVNPPSEPADSGSKKLNQVPPSAVPDLSNRNVQQQGNLQVPYTTDNVTSIALGVITSSSSPNEGINASAQVVVLQSAQSIQVPEDTPTGSGNISPFIRGNSNPQNHLQRFVQGQALPARPLSATQKPPVQPPLPPPASMRRHFSFSNALSLSSHTSSVLSQSGGSGIPANVASEASILSMPHLPTLHTLPLAVDTTTDLLKDLLEEEKKEALSPQTIIQAVSEFYGIPSVEILGKSQAQNCVLPRQIAMHLCRSELKIPYLRLGEIFHRDHSTVMSSIKQVTKKLDGQDRELATAISMIRQKITS